MRSFIPRKCSNCSKVTKNMHGFFNDLCYYCYRKCCVMIPVHRKETLEMFIKQ